ncbi:hypothetical protein [Desulfonatronum thioautotrophicum]|uniref:hypothetical protein n=1 Tax=Desulfonatronum thioautotrophicum TaxID=617001 RepID=UPI0005EB0857|nr:hypothetical protein [Desulfonatronum thioautotrophicum]
MTKPDHAWIADWKVGENSERERKISKELVECFREFWVALDLDGKAKTTRNRYSNALHALGGYLVEKAISEDGLLMTTNELLSEHIDSVGGPLIHHDEEAWQDEIDMVCRKLSKHLKAQGGRA